MLSLDRQNQLREQYRQQRPGWQPATELYAATVRHNLGPSARVLDLGCGRGGLVEQLAHPLAQMVGIDPDWHSLTEHRLPLPRAVGFSDGLPLAGDRFDLIFASWLLEHLERPLLTFQQISRVLRPGGVFIFITPNGRHPIAWLNRGIGRYSRLQAQLVNRLYGRKNDDTFPTWYRANTHAQLENLCQASGLSLIDLQAITDPTYLAFNKTLFRLMIGFESYVPADWQLHLVGVIQRPKSPGTDH